MSKEERLTVRLPSEMCESLKLLAEQHDRTVTAEIRRAVTLYLASPRATGDPDEPWKRIRRNLIITGVLLVIAVALILVNVLAVIQFNA